MLNRVSANWRIVADVGLATQAERKGEDEPHHVSDDQRMNRRQAQAATAPGHPLKEIDQQESAQRQIEQGGCDGYFDREDPEWKKQHDADDGIKRRADVRDDIEPGEQTKYRGERQPGTKNGDQQADASADNADSKSDRERVMAAIKLAYPDLQSIGCPHASPPPDSCKDEQRQSKPGKQTDYGANCVG